MTQSRPNMQVSESVYLHLEQQRDLSQYVMVCWQPVINLLTEEQHYASMADTFGESIGLFPYFY